MKNQDKINTDIFRSIKIIKNYDDITHEALIRLGFTKQQTKIGMVYRIKPYMYYPQIIQLELRDVHPSNSSSGTLGIYSPELKLTVPSKDGKSTKPYTSHESMVNIAWSVNTLTRLREIIDSLVGVK